MIRQFPVVLGGGTSSLSPYVSLNTSDFLLDGTDIGSDTGSGFAGIASTIDFTPDLQGTAWADFNFKNSGFSDTNDILFDLHWIANGGIGSDLVVRLIISAWTVSAGDTPLAVAPIATSTVDLTILTTATGSKQMSAAIFTLGNVDIPATCENVLISITRAATNGADTYTGTFQITKFIGRQV